MPWFLFSGIICPTMVTMQKSARGALSDGQQLQHVAVGILEVHAPTAATVIELPILQRTRTASIGEILFPDPPENRVKLLFAYLKGQVMTLEAPRIRKVQRERIVDANGGKVAPFTLIR